METWVIKLEIGAEAAKFVAELYRQRIAFTVDTQGVWLIIALTGY